MPTHPESGKSLSWFPMHTIYGTRLAIGLMRSKNSSHYNVTQATVTAIVCSPYHSSISPGIANVSNMEDHVYRVDLTFDTVGGVNGSRLWGIRLQCIVLLGLTHIWETEQYKNAYIYLIYMYNVHTHVQYKYMLYVCNMLIKLLHVQDGHNIVTTMWQCCDNFVTTLSI